MNEWLQELEAPGGLSSALALPLPRLRTGQGDQESLPLSLPSPRPRTFMRRRFLDNLVLRSAAMLALLGSAFHR